MQWEIQHFPLCTHHVFLSHCREDRERLVRGVNDALQRQEIIPWFDQHDYPYGRTSFQALRDSVLKSRHVVFFITEAMLLFVDRNDRRLSQSAWHPLVDRAICHQPDGDDPVTWAARQIQMFVLRETQRGLDNATWLEHDSRARGQLARRHGLIERITAVHPVPFPSSDEAS